MCVSAHTRIHKGRFRCLLVHYMADARAVQSVYWQVEQANRALSAQWGAVTDLLRSGLVQAIPTSEALRKKFILPTEYPKSDGGMHRKPVRALYGLGHSAQQRYEADLGLFDQYSKALKVQIDRDNWALDYWVSRARAGEIQAVIWYCKTVLPFLLPAIPGGRPDLVRTAYVIEERRHLIVDLYGPGIEVIPAAQRFEVRGGRYAPYKAEVPTATRGLLYLQFLSSTALLSFDRIFRSEIGSGIDVATVNCISSMLNPSTGHREVVALLSVRADKERLTRLNLGNVNPIDCVVSLDARFTGHPGEYSPITPLASTDADIRAAHPQDVPLLAMDPTEFERLVTELLRRMGLKAERTGQTGDGGVDCVARDERPVVGGVVVVQVKRYTSVVPPSVVRDLFGTVHATGATKGVLVTTSGFGPESREFVQGKPLELIDGKQLEGLLKQYDLGHADLAAERGRSIGAPAPSPNLRAVTIGGPQGDVAVSTATWPDSTNGGPMLASSPANIPLTAGELSKVVAERPRFWEVLLFAGVLRREMERLEARWATYTRGLVAHAGAYLSNAEALELATATLDGVKSSIAHFAHTYDEEGKRAFGPPGAPGDPSLIEQLAVGIVAQFEQLLDIGTRARQANAVPTTDAAVLDLVASVNDQCAGQLHAWVNRVVADVSHLPDAPVAADGTKRSLDLSLTVGPDEELTTRVTAELDRLTALLSQSRVDR
jgi:hypothetical protein